MKTTYLFMIMKTRLTSLSLALLGSFGTAHAAIIASDHFNSSTDANLGYLSNASLASNPNNFGTGWAAGWGNSAAGTATTAPMIRGDAGGNAGAAVAYHGSGTAAAFRTLQSPLTTTDQVWFSMRLHINNNSGTGRLTFYSGATELLATGINGDKWQAGTTSSETIPLSVWRTMTGVIDYANDQVVLWAGTDFSGASYDITTGSSTGEVHTSSWVSTQAIDNIRLSKTGGNNTPVVYFDDLIIASSGNDVGITTIPEPSSALIGGLGFLALLRRRR